MAYAPVHNYGYDAHSTFSSFPEGHGQYPSTQPAHVASQESRLDESQKRYADTDAQEVHPYWGLPGAIPSASSHQRGWSGSTISLEEPSAKSGKGSSTSTSSVLKKAVSLRVRSSWSFEIFTLLISWAAVGAMMGVLAWYNERALPEWPYYITLNALIALLATIATASMSVSLQNGLSQLKWIRFKDAQAPLADMEVFDEASRGTWGALKLLTSARGGFLGSFGAVVAIVALALGPFAQQVVTYQTRAVETQQGASINRALNYTGALPSNTSSTGFVPILPLKSAVYNGLFAENGRPGAALAFECQSGNCTWDTYETLAVCHECVDLTPFIQQYCAPASNDTDGESDTNANVGCGWQVPQGARLASAAEVFSMTSHVPAARGDMPHSTLVKLIFMGTEEAGPVVPVGSSSTRPWARQCVLAACVQTLESTVASGVLRERVVDSYVNTTVLDISGPADGGGDRDAYVANPRRRGDEDGNGEGAFYVLGISSLLAMRGWFASVFATGGAVRAPSSFNRTVTSSSSSSSGNNNDGVVVNLTVGISSGETFFDSDVVTAFYWNYYQYGSGSGGEDDEGGLDMLMRDTATSMTVAFRSFVGSEAVRGRATAVESYVRVRWGFAVLPIVVVAGAAVFLAAAAHRAKRSRTPVWKSSAMAVLLHGLDADTRAHIGQAGGLREQKRRAGDVRVRLDEGDDGGTLLRA
ncbi:hypothetical protein GGR54DRAFT_321220 [Hypoxylon sp. NC1633]|nr:hypothetical protein GGR54DRAFT_321220 [Hypoxylon sp. NC1633]